VISPNNLPPSYQISRARHSAVADARRERQAILRAMPVADFIGRTQIEVPHDTTMALVPFTLWEAQRAALDVMLRDRLIIYLKARQLGLSWLVCGYVLWRCALHDGQTALFLSRGEDEAQELVRRVRILQEHHQDAATLNPIITPNLERMVWSGGSRILSQAATKNAGRSFAASVAVLDEFAFMQWPKQTLAAVKPTIDAGGQLIIISSANGANTDYHAMCLAAESGANGYTFHFIPWQAHPNRGEGWREARIREADDDRATILREYPATPLEAFTNAAGVVFDVWDDADGVTEAAEYDPHGGPVYWALDDGYSAGSKPGTAGIDPATRAYVHDAHPRVILFVQHRADGGLNVFAESYACLQLSGDHLAAALLSPYARPSYVVHGPGAAEIGGQLHKQSLSYMQSTASVEESIKVMRGAMAADQNGWRRVRIHPRCVHLRQELLSYRYNADGKPIKAFDHGIDALRGLLWMQQWEW
jgi:hypothetical protein